MPLTPAEQKRLDDLERELRGLKQRANERSGQYRETRAELTRKISDSQHDIEDRAMGFERLMLDSMAATRAELAEVKASIPPATRAAIQAGNKTDAVQFTANETEKKVDTVSTRTKWQTLAIIASSLATIASILERLLH